MNNPKLASTNDDALQAAMGNYFAALGRKDFKDADHWQAEMKRLRDVQGGEMAELMRKGGK